MFGESYHYPFRCIDVTDSGNSASLVNPGLFGTQLLLCYRVGGDDKPAITEIRYVILNSLHSCVMTTRLLFLCLCA